MIGCRAETVNRPRFSFVRARKPVDTCHRSAGNSKIESRCGDVPNQCVTHRKRQRLRRIQTLDQWRRQETESTQKAEIRRSKRSERSSMRNDFKEGGRQATLIATEAIAERPKEISGE
eukprot:6175360-Pleurochrysis_carterae.AAC.2